MHAVAVRVKINDVEAGEQMLNSEVVPMVSQIPGFVSGVWSRDEAGTNGMSLMVFESEDAAKQVAQRLQTEGPGANDAVDLESVEVRVVVASA